MLLRAKFVLYAASTKREAFIAGFRERAVPVSQTVTDCPDPKDNIFLALADTSQAEMLISSDPQLVDMHPWWEIPILPPAAFLERNQGSRLSANGELLPRPETTSRVGEEPKTVL